MRFSLFPFSDDNKRASDSLIRHLILYLHVQEYGALCGKSSMLVSWQWPVDVMNILGIPR
jgi:hypothetical protein